ncbi:MAG TPA: TIGR01777 family oxidoreductase, partial [Acidimicrobiales bacterium]
MRVVISGSSGLIGRSVVAGLRARGDEVTPLVRRAPAAGEARWDPGAGTVDTGALEGAGAVVHLAGAGIGDKRWSATRRHVIMSSRVQGTALLARALGGLGHPPTVFLSASAVGFYGDRGGEELSEASEAGHGFLAEVCRAWEDATAPAEHSGVRVVRLRSGVVLSAQGGALARQLPLFRFGLGGRLGSGRQWLSWISLADEVRAILYALDHQAVRGAVNVTAPAPVTNRDFTHALGRALHRPAVLAVPGPALRVALGSDLASEMVLASQRVVPTALLAAGFAFDHAGVDDALAHALSTGV